MSSDPRSPAGRRGRSTRPGRATGHGAPLLLLALACFCLVWTPGCGHKKAPTPPPSKMPQRATITAHQRGSEVIVEFPYPSTTISGTPLDGISKIELWRFGMEVPEAAVELLAEEAQQRLDAQDLLDELGLELYETPAPTTGEEGAPVGAPPLEGTTSAGVPPPADEPEATEMETADAEILEPEGLEPGDAGEESLEDEDSETARGTSEEDAGDAPTIDASGAESESAEGDDAESVDPDAPQLTPEEELALRIEAARNLLRSPPTDKSTFITATAKDFKQGAELVLSVEDGDIGSVVVGDVIVLRAPLPARPEEGPETGYLFAVKLFPLKGKPSDLSNNVALLPESTPAAPHDLTVEAQADGVLLAWSSEEEPASGFRVYRRDAQARTYGKPHAILASGAVLSFVDRQAVYGARYIYGVTAVASTSPLLESDISSEHEVDYQDRFGPAVPGGLVAFPETGRVRLLWTPVADPDLAGYEILRRASTEEEPVVLNDELVTRSQYLDEAVAPGEIWLYSVVSVDQLGNRSAAGLEARARVP